jgi:hypothetical protein
MRIHHGPQEVIIQSFMNMETGKPKDGSLQDGEQEGIPVGENPRGVMSCDHEGSPRVTQGDRIEKHIKGITRYM